MNKIFLVAAIAIISFTSCKKTIESIINKTLDKTNGLNKYAEYIIARGQQSANLHSYQTTAYDEQKFVVKFDSSAIYQTINPANQGDVNKLFGFADNNSEHLQFSARFGWNWTAEGLALFAYTYNNSIRSIQKLGNISIGTENNCSIKVAGDAYIFTLNGNSVSMPRASTTPKGAGYKLYPFFGGDEYAPRDIHIWIKEL